MNWLILSLPTRERELKSRWEDGERIVEGSLPTRERELKYLEKRVLIY